MAADVDLARHAEVADGGAVDVLERGSAVTRQEVECQRVVVAVEGAAEYCGRGCAAICGICGICVRQRSVLFLWKLITII